MTVIAICEAEADPGVVVAALFGLIAYAGCVWAAVLRGPSVVRARTLIVYGVSFVVGPMIMATPGGFGDPDGNYPLRACVAILAGIGIGAGMSHVAGWLRPPRLMFAGALGAVGLAGGLIALLAVALGSGRTCFG